ncbi:MAG TPA: response regulator, partial [Ottowia sp.]|nr:response regulator [Ottowia sp.]
MNAPVNLTGTARVLVVDDEPDLRTLYELTLLREGHQVESAGSLAEARALLAASTYDVIITDMRLTDGLGLELLRDMAAAQRRERSIVITAYGSAENAVEALKCGAFDYLTKPIDLKQFRGVVSAALQAPGPASDHESAPPPAAARAPQPPEATAPAAAPTDAGTAALARLVGESAAMRAVKQRIAKVARSMAPVLVHGESGTG